MNGAQNDASDITWAHAVNSWDALEKALAGPIDFLEADISLGHVVGHEQGPSVPIMAHPPDVSSDISLDTWLNMVQKKGPSKGIKLDFKSLSVVEPSLSILEKYASKLNGSLWLSADILPGPVHPTVDPVPGDEFLILCKKYFPRIPLLLGWTTKWIRRYPENSLLYDWKHVRQMSDAVRCVYRDKNPSITFSIRAIFASRSIKQLKWLLRVVPRSSLLIWSGSGDNVVTEDIVSIQKVFSNEKVYYDLPDTLYKPYKRAKTKSTSSIGRKNPEDSGWETITRDKSCEAFNYIDSSSILFGRPSNSAVLQKSLIAADGSRNFTLTGRLKFFAGDHTINPTHWEHKLSIVFADIGKLPKNAISYSRKKMIYSVRYPDVLWKAVNTSVLYTFEHVYFQESTACRMFKVDFTPNFGSMNLSFEAWTIPCDSTYDDNTHEEVSKVSIPEVSLDEVFDGDDGMFMIGFHSYGEEHVLVYDLDIVIQEKEPEFLTVLPKLQLSLTSSHTRLKENLFIIISLLFTPLLLVSPFFKLRTTL